MTLAAELLRTDVEEVDFSKVVKNVDSGITGGLDASYKNGDIVLKARAEHVADDNNIKNISGDTASQWEKVTSTGHFRRRRKRFRIRRRVHFRRWLKRPIPTQGSM